MQHSDYFISKATKALSGTISVPGDKSITHRAIIFAALAEGRSIIHGYLKANDCLATLKALQSMGVEIVIDDNKLIIHGVGKYGLHPPKTAIDCGNSGTSMRLLAGLLAAQAFDSELTGDESLLKRPMDRIIAPLSQMGAKIVSSNGLPPLKIRGGQNLTSIHYPMPLASAQVKSAILLAGLYAEGTTSIVESGVSRDHSERMLEAFAYPIQKNQDQIYISSTAQLEPLEMTVPGDISSAAFFIVAAAIKPGSSLCIQQVGLNPSRNAIITLLQMMGANIEISHLNYCGTEPIADIQIRYAPLKGIRVPAHLVSIAIDEFPILCIAAASASGQTIFRHAKELRVKESDRIEAMARGLTELGIKVQTFEDGLAIEGGIMQGGSVHSFSDHRIAMAFAIAGIIAKTPISIYDVSNVNTSFPSFAETARAIGINLQETPHEQ